MEQSEYLTLGFADCMMGIAVLLFVAGSCMAKPAGELAVEVAVLWGGSKH